MATGKHRAETGKHRAEKSRTDKLTLDKDAAILEACLGAIGIARIETDASDRVVHLNAAAEKTTGWSNLEAHGEPLVKVFRLVAPPQPKTAPPQQTADSSLHRMHTVFSPDRTAVLERRDGTTVPVRHAVGAAPDKKAGKFVLFRDLSAEQFLSLQLAGQTDCDPLTGLLNRRSIEDRITRALADGQRRGTRHGLCYFDLDRFRLINLTCGHDAGDDLLQWVAGRIHEVLGPSDSAARIGADEFVILLVDRGEHEIEQVIKDLQQRLLEFRFAWGQKSFAVAASFGLVFFGAEDAQAGELLSSADVACRHAKDHGGGRVHRQVPDDEEDQHDRRSMNWVASLQRNLAEGRLLLFAQGVHPLAPRPGHGAHFEVLVRQVGEDGKLNSPVRIIKAAENIGLMGAIDRFVIRQTLRTLGSLPTQNLRRIDACAINLSGVSLHSPDLLDFIVGEFAQAKVPPSKVCFEITETAAMANLDEVLWLMQELKAMGSRFAIDDFGSGHASYAYVERLPVDHVKIDGAFVRDLLDNPVHRAIVESIHLIGRTLKIKTVAESVELQEVADLLTEIGIDAAQGWLFDKPRPLLELCMALK